MKKFLLLATLLFVTSDAWAAARYWVGGTGNWDAVTTTNWSASSGGAGGASVPGASDDVTFDGSSGGGTVTVTATQTVNSITSGAHTGTINTNGQTINTGTWTNSGTATRTVTLGASAINITGTGNSFNWGTSTNLTFNSNTSTITLNGSGIGTISFGTSLAYYNVVIAPSANNGGIAVNGSGCTFNTYTYTGTTGKLDQLIHNSTLTATTANLNGNSATNRLLFRSNTLGTQRVFTVTTLNASNLDLRDISFGSSKDLSAITGLSGDCGGNSGITFTTSQTNYWVGGTGNWSDVNEWASSSGGAGASGRVPLPQDHARFDASSFSAGSQTVTADMPRLGTNIDWTGATNSPTWAVNSTGNTNYGSLTLISGMTFTSNQSWTFEGRSSFTLTSAGKTFGGQVNVSMVSGTLSLQDAFAISTANAVVTNGTFTTNGYNLSTFGQDSNSGTPTINLGSSTWTVTRTGTPWRLAATVTLNAGTSTLLISDTSASSKTFAGGGLTYNNLQITGGGAGAVILTGANTFSGTVTIGSPKVVTFPSSTTTTLTGGLSATGTLGNEIQINSSSAGTAATLSSASGTISANYLIIKDSTATGGTYWFAGQNSIGGTGVSGWRFTNPSISSIQSMGNATFIKDYQAGWNLAADYSVGSGIATMTSTRSSGSPGTYVDSSGTIRLAPTVDNTPRFTAGFYDSTGFVSRPGLIVEGASTNQLRDSAFENSTITTNWSNLGGTLSRSTDYTNPYGGGSVAKLVCTAADDRFGFTGYSPTVTSGTVYTVSALVRSTTTDPLYFRYSDGVVQTSGNYTPSTTAWTLIQWQVTAGATGSLAGLNIANKNAVSRTFYVAYMQFEALPFASTFIPTTTAALTRNAETLTYPISGNRTAATESVFLKATHTYTAQNDGAVRIMLSTNTKSREFSKSSTGTQYAARANSTDSSANAAGFGTTSGGTSYVFSGVHHSATGDPNTTSYLNGSSISVDNDDYTAPAWGTNFYIGSNNAGAEYAYGIYESLAIFSDAKSAADVSTITNYMNGLSSDSLLNYPFPYQRKTDTR